MNQILIILLGLLISTGIQAKEYGEKILIKEKPIPISEFKKLVNGSSSSEHVLIATAEKVCKKKGCWMSIKNGSEEIRIKFKDYGFFIPSKLTGKEFLAQGILHKKIISEKDRKHYLKDAGAPKKEIESINGSKEEFVFIASGVRFL